MSKRQELYPIADKGFLTGLSIMVIMDTLSL